MSVNEMKRKQKINSKRKGKVEQKGKIYEEKLRGNFKSEN